LIAGLLYMLRRPYKNFDREIFLTFDHGSTTQAIANKLAETGVVRYPWEILLARALHPGSTLQAGEYQFQQTASPLEIFERLRKGDVYYFNVTVPEGSNIFDIARMLEDQGAMPMADFLRAAADPALIRDLAPGAKTLEGYLFPSTYRLTH